MIRKVHQPRWGVRDEVLSGLHPKTTNSWNCRADPLFMRKYRGNRSRFWTAHYRRNPPQRTRPIPTTNIPQSQRHPVWVSGYKQESL